MLRVGARVLLLGGLLASPLSASQAPGRGAVEPLSIGKTFTVHSAVLGERRRINVYTPAAYGALPDQRFPVLYMPDGGIEEDFLHLAGLVQILSLNGSMRPVILVGIENAERRRDLTGPTSTPSDREVAPRIGGSADFRGFIRDELMPVVNDGYRTSGETAIVGESLAGLFVIETLLVEPELFDSYLAIALPRGKQSGRDRGADRPSGRRASGPSASDRPDPREVSRGDPPDDLSSCCARWVQESPGPSGTRAALRSASGLRNDRPWLSRAWGRACDRTTPTVVR